MQKSKIISLLLYFAPAVGAAQGASSAISFTPFTFAGAGDAKTEADSGTLVVPANRQRRSSGRVTLPVVRFRTTSATPGNPVIYVSGGSGSGIAAARGARFNMFMALRGIGDVITLDLRGAGKSTPRVDCGGTGLPGIGEPMTYNAVSKSLSDHARKCADSLRAAGVDLSGHNVREVVEDIDAVRRGLGATRINLVGISTGSQIVLEYLRRHPANVDRIIAAGVQAPDQNRHMSEEQENVVRLLPGNLVALVTRVLDTLEAHPQTVSVKNGANTIVVGLGKFDAQLLVAGTLGDRRPMAFLPRLFGAAAKGDYTMLAGAKIQGARSGITSAYEAAMDCQTSAPANRIAEVNRQAKSSLLGYGTLDFPEQCTAWGVKPLDNSFRKPVRSNTPVLLISGTLDGRTPVRNAREALGYLSNGSHLVIDGASHGDDLFLGSPEIVPTMIRFLSHENLSRHLLLKVR
ncbi:MAG: alpha/beta fold hydrolase [Gemmatimonadaceae bacterium]|nr:alpha/beta fold hydrolase [Gemmatimonadaceae bacterium]